VSFKDWELYFLSIIKSEKKGFVPSFLRGFLWLLSLPFAFLVGLRNWAYDHGWVSSYTPPIPLVISIGNIVAGGTGKTPVTLLIADEFYPQTPLGILSRGYRSLAEKLRLPVVVCKGNGAIHPASYCGDEPYLLAQNLPKAFIAVGRDRRKAAKIAAKAGCKVLLMDDAMQHRAIARDLEVVVMDTLDPFGQGYYLPRGLLREGVSGLGRADLIILNHTGDHTRYEALKRQLSHSTSAPVVGTQMEVVGVFDLMGEPVTLSGQNVALFCGIARPEYFLKTVEQLGAAVVAQFAMADHDVVDLEVLMEYARNSQKKGATVLVCTEKDRVKLENPVELPLSIVWVKTRLRVVEGQQAWTHFIARSKASLRST